VIRLTYADDHLPPHFHAKYSGQEAQVSIRDGTVIRGGGVKVEIQRIDARNSPTAR